MHTTTNFDSHNLPIACFHHATTPANEIRTSSWSFTSVQPTPAASTGTLNFPLIQFPPLHIEGATRFIHNIRQLLIRKVWSIVIKQGEHSEFINIERPHFIDLPITWWLGHVIWSHINFLFHSRPRVWVHSSYRKLSSSTLIVTAVALFKRSVCARN